VDNSLTRRLWTHLQGSPEKTTYLLTRAFFLRGIGALYAVSFFILVRQGDALIGSGGLLPVPRFLDRVHTHLGEDAFFRVPTLFWLDASDATLHLAAYGGLGLSMVVVLGFANAPILLALWALTLSFVNVGQQFWGFGWENYLVELGFLAIFLCPAWTVHPIPEDKPVNPFVVWLLRWVLFRMMLGAGLIKLRGDPCWTELTCLETFYETQPNPHPLSWVWHQAPRWFLTSGVLLNHVVELVGPFLLFGPRRLRHAGGGLMIGFQILLILGGNLAFLNWLTIVNAIACFDDTLLRRIVPHGIGNVAWQRGMQPTPRTVAARVHAALVGAVALGVAYLSIAPVANLLSENQAMNRTHDPMRWVNSYGMFGSISDERLEVIIVGTLDDPSRPDATWREYVFPCKPGPPERAPCIVTPYHHRLDWQVWFTPLTRSYDPWLVHFLYKLLIADPLVLDRLAVDPFDGQRPKALRVDLYRYQFAEAHQSQWWNREWVETFIPPLTLQNPRLIETLEASGFVNQP
jgi:hypothetical protein